MFAIVSAAERSDLPRIVLHHTDVLQDDDKKATLLRYPAVRLVRIDPVAHLSRIGRTLGLGEALGALYQRLQEPVMRSDVLRAALLYEQGGMYLDLDTVTVASLLPLTGRKLFIGSEWIVWTRAARLSRAPLGLARRLALDVLRKLLRRMPGGWRVFRRIARFYDLGVNNAVMGAQAGSNFFADYLRAMVALPAGRAARPYALGPHLLREVVDRYTGDDLTIFEPDIFYPFSPEISEHLFRSRGRLRSTAVLPTTTRIVHWYASVRTRPAVAEVCPDYIRDRRHCQMYSALLSSCVDRLAEAA